MAKTDVWTLTGPASLIQRGNALTGETPLELSNNYSLSEGVVQMRQAFSVEDYSASNLDGSVEWIGRHVSNAGIEEAFAASNNGGTAELGRRVSGVWSPSAFSDTASASNLRFMDAITQNGKYFMCYDSNVNRLHVWDGTSVRRVGLAEASAVTAAAMGAGALAFNRWYRKRVVVQESGVTVRRSEPSPTYVNVSIAANLGVTVTRGTVPGEGETHWEVEASNNSGTAPTVWYRIATVAIGTLTFNDTNSAITTFPVSDLLGLYIPPPSAKYIVSDGAVLLMGGAWETVAAAGETEPKQNRVWFTRPLGSSDVSDDESIPDIPGEQQNWIDVGDGGPITGVIGPISGEVYVFKAASLYKLVPTGDLVTPYARVLVSPAHGSINKRVITEGDLGGVPAVYFADETALYAMAAGGGVQTVSDGIARDLRQTEITATDSFVSFDPFQRILLFQVSSAPPTVTGTYRSFTFDTAKQRWSGFELGGAISGWILGVGVLGVTTVIGGTGAAIVNSAYLDTPGSGRRLYLCGQTIANVGALFVWGGQVGIDATNPYTTVARYRRAFAAATGQKVTIGNPTVWYRNPQGTTTGTCSLLLSFIRDDDETRSQTVTLTATGDENGIAVRQVTLEGMASADVSTLDVRVFLSYSGTAFTSVTTPSVEAITIPVTVQEPLAR